MPEETPTAAETNANNGEIKKESADDFEERKRKRSRSRSRSRSPRRSSGAGGGGGSYKRDRKSGAAGFDNDKMVYISNIPYDVRWMEVKDLVREKAGDVNFVEILETPDGKSKGCAVVEFKDAEGVKKCIEAMHRMQMKDRYIVAKEIRDPVAFFRKVKDDTGVDFLARGSGGGSSGGGRFSGGGDRGGRGLGGGDGRRPPPVSGTYETHGLSPTFLRQLGIDGPLCNRVFVANLAYNIQSGKIMDVFALAGKVNWVDLQLDKEGKSKGFCVVEYSHPIEAVQSISMLNNQKLYDRSITVKMDRYEKPPEKRPGELPNGLRAVGMGLGANGAPLANIAQLLGSSNPSPAGSLAFQQQQSMYSSGGGGPSMGGTGLLGSNYSSSGGGAMISSYGSSAGGAPSLGAFGGGGGYEAGLGGYTGSMSREVGAQPYGYGDRLRSDFDAGPARPNRVIMIRNLPPDYTWQMVRDRLRGYGDIEFADIISPGIAKVRFKLVIDGERARTALHGTSVEGRPITVDYGFTD